MRCKSNYNSWIFFLKKMLCLQFYFFSFNMILATSGINQHKPV
ncbi:MAG: hypothetical protein OJF59_001184 [Cytophagales bacterium]|nr:MAG: hypothetical protein OJF59_001184 [Cytophagales bacterium]